MYIYIYSVWIHIGTWGGLVICVYIYIYSVWIHIGTWGGLVVALGGVERLHLYGAREVAWGRLNDGDTSSYVYIFHVCIYTCIHTYRVLTLWGRGGGLRGGGFTSG